jgi:DNA-binding HxlR family transcriptional regulator
MAIGANLDGTKDGYRHIPTAAIGRGLSSLRPSQLTHHSISERRQFAPQEQAAIRFALALVQGKWKIGILCRLQEGPARPGELHRLFPHASKKMLTQHLRQMERDGLIVRTDLTGKVPHVEYSLSNSLGRSVVNLIDFLAQWGTALVANGCIGHHLGN